MGSPGCSGVKYKVCCEDICVAQPSEEGSGSQLFFSESFISFLSEGATQVSKPTFEHDQEPRRCLCLLNGSPMSDESCPFPRVSFHCLSWQRSSSCNQTVLVPERLLGPLEPQSKLSCLSSSAAEAEALQAQQQAREPAVPISLL